MLAAQAAQELPVLLDSLEGSRIVGKDPACGGETGNKEGLAGLPEPTVGKILELAPAVDFPDRKCLISVIVEASHIRNVMVAHAFPTRASDCADGTRGGLVGKEANS